MSKKARIHTNHQLEEVTKKLNLLLDVVEVTVKGPDGNTATISAGQLYEMSKRLRLTPTKDTSNGAK